MRCWFAPILSSTLTDALQGTFRAPDETDQVPENGDLNFEGEITNYASTPAAISEDSTQYSIT